MAERNTRRPDTGSFLDSTTTSTRCARRVEREQLLHQRERHAVARRHVEPRVLQRDVRAPRRRSRTRGSRPRSRTARARRSRRPACLRPNTAMALPRRDYLIVSCEHGGNRVPSPFRRFSPKRLLDTHRGYDPGALAVARDIANATRRSALLLDDQPPAGRAQPPARPSAAFLQGFSEEHPGRAASPLLLPLLERGRQGRAARRARHSSFGATASRRACAARRARSTSACSSIPPGAAEAAFCRRWHEELHRLSPRLRVRDNEPYPGVFPSLVDALRNELGPRRYVGIQIEVNQKFPAR